MKKYKWLYIKEYHSEETDYDIYFVFWKSIYVKQLYKDVTWENDSDEEVWWFQFKPPRGRKIYIYINTYENWVTDESKDNIDKDGFYRDTIIHETIHWIQCMFDYIQRPMWYDECEPFAYYCSYWINKWLQFLEEIKSLDNY